MTTRIILSLLLFYPCTAFANPAEDIRRANELYNQGGFAQSARIYRKLLESGLESAALYYNLGNAELRRERVGHAIAAYRRALRLQANDTSLQHNLRLARLEAGTFRESTLPVANTAWWNLNAHIGARAVLLGFLSSYGLLCILLGVWSVWRFRMSLYLAALSGISCICFGSAHFFIREDTFGIESLSWSPASYAVVIASGGEARAGNGPIFQVVDTLTEGEEVRVLELRDKWAHIERPEKRNGWVKKDMLELL